MKDRFDSVDDGPEIETKEKGSRFLGQAFRADGEGAARERLDSVRRKHHAATHHCWAWRLGPPEDPAERSDDDGEPSGTAGTPILAALQGAEVHGALLVVTRYYGGTKLGRGGLVRAYGDAARLALEATPRRAVWRESRISIECEYADVGSVEAILAKEGAGIRACRRDFSGDPVFEVQVLRSDAPGLAERLREGTAGRARVNIDGG